MLAAGDSQRVAELMRETAAAELLPRFRNLASDEVRQKRPGDIVTVADVASEQRLAAGLAKILPGVPMVGEEAVEKDPGLLDLIGRPDESCWIVDPLDGTANFAAGRDRFAMIVCLVHDVQTVAGWILDVPNGKLAAAVKGQGVTFDGASIDSLAPHQPLHGFVGFKVRKAFERQFSSRQHTVLGNLTSLGCAGKEYLEILAGRRDFSLYRRTKPWDHAAGALMIAEAGGVAARFDGTPYGPASGIDDGIMTATSPQVLAKVSAAFEAVEMPLLAAKPT